MSSKISNLFFLWLCSALPVLFPSCGSTSSETENNSVVRTPVTITSVSIKPIAESIELPAVSQYMRKNIIRATTSGIIEKIMIRQGDYVNADQLLFTVRTRESVALQKVPENDSSLVFSGLIRILAHEAGVINSVSYQKGDFVQEGDAVAVLSDQGSLIFTLEVPFEFKSLAEKNRECLIILPDSTELRGIITGKLPEMNVESQTVSYIIKPQSSARLPAGLIARVSLIKSSKEKAQVLPRAAVLSNETQSRFWVMKLVNDSTAVRVDIVKGSENKVETEIIEPQFLDSERIIIEGNYGLADTALITLGEN